MSSRIKYRTISLLVTGFAAVGALSVPVAAAAHPTCEDSGTHAVCQTNGSVAIKAVPQAKGSGNPDPSLRVGSQGRRSCYLGQYERSHICQY